MKLKFFIPIGLFVLMIALLYKGLSLDPKIIPSPFIDKPVPQFSAKTLYNTKETLTANDFLGEVWVLNVFASWCFSCRAEHQVITRLAQSSNVAVIGLNYKDEEADAKKWLAYYGNPYRAIAIDLNGEIGLEFGVYGVPESFVMDKKGIIRYKQIGPMDDKTLDEIILPLVKKLQKEHA